jgi:hypothetical protein
VFLFCLDFRFGSVTFLRFFPSFEMACVEHSLGAGGGGGGGSGGVAGLLVLGAEGELHVFDAPALAAAGAEPTLGSLTRREVQFYSAPYLTSEDNASLVSAMSARPRRTVGAVLDKLIDALGGPRHNAAQDELRRRLTRLGVAPQDSWQAQHLAVKHPDEDNFMMPENGRVVDNELHMSDGEHHSMDEKYYEAGYKLYFSDAGRAWKSLVSRSCACLLVTLTLTPALPVTLTLPHTPTAAAA